jgi:hypothetical protein
LKAGCIVLSELSVLLQSGFNLDQINKAVRDLKAQVEKTTLNFKVNFDAGGITSQIQKNSKFKLDLDIDSMRTKQVLADVQKIGAGIAKLDLPAGNKLTKSYESLTKKMQAAFDAKRPETQQRRVLALSDNVKQLGVAYQEMLVSQKEAALAPAREVKALDFGAQIKRQLDSIPVSTLRANLERLRGQGIIDASQLDVAEERFALGECMGTTCPFNASSGTMSWYDSPGTLRNRINSLRDALPTELQDAIKTVVKGTTNRTGAQTILNLDLWAFGLCEVGYSSPIYPLPLQTVYPGLDSAAKRIRLLSGAANTWWTRDMQSAEWASAVTANGVIQPLANVQVAAVGVVFGFSV